jgi:hypothetical protein
LLPVRLVRRCLRGPMVASACSPPAGPGKQIHACQAVALLTRSVGEQAILTAFGQSSLLTGKPV